MSELIMRFKLWAAFDALTNLGARPWHIELDPARPWHIVLEPEPPVLVLNHRAACGALVTPSLVLRDLPKDVLAESTALLCQQPDCAAHWLQVKNEQPKAGQPLDSALQAQVVKAVEQL